ncbi:putative protoheme IX farnesyltransferase [Mycobacterium xenopi 3993]|nr:putative protoheme IX farnesyltransferase [Mycobacterium xenopi 3993]
MGGWLHAGDDRLVGGHGHHRLAGAGDVRDHLLLDPPHTWALAMRYRDDYKAAGVPMLPAVATEREVTGRILVYTWLTVFATLVLALSAGWLYATVAVLAGVWFLAMAHQLYAGVRRGEPVKPLRLFLQSNNYLAVLFCALAVDSVLNLPILLGT